MRVIDGDQREKRVKKQKEIESIFMVLKKKKSKFKNI
jgi:hypothetical protein